MKRLSCACVVLFSCTCVSVSAKEGYESASGTLLLKNYYMNRDFRSPGEQSLAAEWAQGAVFKATGGYDGGLSGIGADVYLGQGLRLDSSDSRAGTSLMPSRYGHAAPSEFSEGAVAIKAFYSKTELKVGQFMPKIPLVSSGDSRLLPQTFQGYMVASKEISDLGLFFGEMTKANYRNSTDYQPIVVGNYTFASSDQFRYQGVQYSFSPNATVSVWNGTLENAYNQKMINGIFSKKIDDLTVTTNAAFFKTIESGSEIIGKIDSNLTSLSLSGKYRGHGVTLGYQANTGGSAFAFLDETDLSIVNGIQIMDFTRADEKSWQFRYDFDFAALGMPGLTAFARYVEGRGFTVAGNDGEEWERNFDVAYTLQSTRLKDLTVRLRNATVRSDARRDIDEFRVIVSYPISLF